MTATATRAAVPGVSENPHAGQGSVLLDIGGDVGALVVTMPESMLGEEVEIRPLGGGSTRASGHDHPHDHPHGSGHLAHVAVVSRPVAGGQIPSLVFGELTDGGYELFAKGHPEAVALRVDVVGGEVSWVEWVA
jgi:hypothetical protein